jgi:hypothetical protein
VQSTRPRHWLRIATALSLCGTCVSVSACDWVAYPYAGRCSSIALGTPIAELPATDLDGGCLPRGAYLKTDAEWRQRCEIPRPSAGPDAGEVQKGLPLADGGFDPSWCGACYSVGGEYVAEPCGAYGGHVLYCGAFVRDGLVVATHGFCND